MSDEKNVEKKANTHKVDYAAAQKQAGDTPKPASTEKRETKKLDEKPVQLHGTIRKKSTFTKIKEEFFGDSPDSVKNYVIDDVIIPSVKSLISSAVTSGINALLYGHDNARSRSNGYSGSQNVRNYNSAPSEPNGQPRRVNYNA